ncbi:MAG: serpin family protein, partial [Longimicrobiales bacterium]|nr:serpin family protein [Longimicrobiales bacterium]
GETFDGMRDALAYEDLSQEEINTAYRDLIDLLVALDPAVRFDIANAVWTNEEIPFLQSFLTAVQEAFSAQTSSSDFADPATLNAINAWVESATDGKIDTILEELDPDQVALLLNAIYFDGAWTVEFDPSETALEPFTLEDGSTVQVPMMSIADEEFPLAWAPEYAAAELPYGGGAYAMLVVVPSDDARAFLETLDVEGWNDIVASLVPAEVDRLAIPKLSLSWDGFLNDALKAMGMDVAFANAADFSAMSPLGSDLCIDFVRQKTFLEVDERGTRAAAVTAVGVGPTSFTGLVADRPFLFAIRERLSGTILFSGIIGDPTAEDPGAGDVMDTCG